MWKPYQVTNGERIESPSLRDAYSQIGKGIDRALDWSYENNKGIRTVGGFGLALAGLGGAVMSSGIEPQNLRSLAAVGSMMLSSMGLCFLLSAAGDYRSDARNTARELRAVRQN